GQHPTLTIESEAEAGHTLLALLLRDPWVALCLSSQARSCACHVARTLTVEEAGLAGAGEGAGGVATGAGTTAGSRCCTGGRSTGLAFGLGLGGCGSGRTTAGCGVGLGSTAGAGAGSGSTNCSGCGGVGSAGGAASDGAGGACARSILTAARGVTSA